MAQIKLKQVVGKFYSTYDLSSGEVVAAEFEKKKDDWYVRTYPPTAGNPSNNIHLFYSGTKGDFLELPFEKFSSPVEADSLKYIVEGDEFYYNLLPYYGYNGWYHDVIKEYGMMDNLSDNQLYSLGKAYVQWALSLVMNINYSVPGESFQLYFNLNTLSGKQLERYSMLIDSGLAKYHQLLMRNPEYQTPVGNIRFKYAFDIMDRFSVMMAVANREAEKLTIPANIFPDSALLKARSWLRACSPNSILVTFHDSDYYSILYVQKAERFRTDVYLLNYNLLFIDRFIYKATQKQFGARGIRLSSDTSIYRRNLNDGVYLEDNPTSRSVAELIQLFKKRTKNDGLDYLTFTGRELYFDNTKPSVTISLADIKFIFKNQWILLDLLNSEQRKIFFTRKFDDELSSLNSFLKRSHDIYLYVH